MRRSQILLPLLAVALSVCGCIQWTAPVQPPRGALFTGYKAPLTADVADVDVRAGRVGTASTLYFHDPIFTGMNYAWEDAGIAAAAQDGGIARVRYADYEIMEVLGIFGRFTVVAHGD